MLIEIVKILLRPISGKRKFQQMFEALNQLNQLSLVGMNIGGGSDPKDSGERSALEYINNRLRSVNEIVLFDVGTNIGNYSILLKEVFGEKG